MKIIVLGNTPWALFTAYKLRARLILHPIPEKPDPFSLYSCFSGIPRVSELAPEGQMAAISIGKELIPYPFQLFFYPLPQRAKMELLRDYINAYHSSCSGARNLEEWFLYRFGKAMSELFFLPYNTKLWGISLRKLSHSWADALNPRPNPEEIYFGSQGKLENLNYKPPEIIPRQTIKMLVENLPVETIEARAVEINYREKSLRTSVGEETYDLLISFIPLKELLGLLIPRENIFSLGRELLRESPRKVVKFTASLSLTYHKLYFPLSPFPFIKIFSIDQSVILEIPGKEADIKSIASLLVEAGLISNRPTGATVSETYLPLPTLEVYMFRDGILERLRKEGIISTGMWGRWEYMGECREFSFITAEIDSLIGVES